MPEMGSGLFSGTWENEELVNVSVAVKAPEAFELLLIVPVHCP